MRRSRARTRGVLALALAIASFVTVANAARHGAHASDASEDDSGRVNTLAGTPSQTPILYAHFSDSDSMEVEVKRLRCFAAVARRTKRELVIVEGAAETKTARRTALDFVVPAPETAWRRWNEGDDERIERGDARWCAHVRHATEAQAVMAVEHKFSKASAAACLTFESAQASCGRAERLVLTAEYSKSKALPSEIEALVRAGEVLRELVAKSESEEDVATMGSTEEEAPQATALSVSEESEKVPEVKLLRSTWKRQSSATRTVDTSRALIFFAAAVGMVGFFINSFAFARQASRRDELAALVLDPERVARPYATIRSKDEVKG
jgi:hypothetical protein